jgi:hypothetical protein
LGIAQPKGVLLYGPPGLRPCVSCRCATVYLSWFFLHASLVEGNKKLKHAISANLTQPGIFRLILC